MFLLFGNTYHSNSYGGDSQTRHHYPTHTSPDSITIMNKVFGILLVGLVLTLVGTDYAWAGNWNTTKKGVGLHGVYKDEDWSHTFYNNCGFPSKKNVKWHTENDIRFLRFTLKDKQKIS